MNHSVLTLAQAAPNVITSQVRVPVQLHAPVQMPVQVPVQVPVQMPVQVPVPSPTQSGPSGPPTALQNALPNSSIPTQPPHPGVAPGSGLLSIQRLPAPLDAQHRREALVGRWFGETQLGDGRKLRWLTERDANGTYRTQYVMGRAPQPNRPQGASTNPGQANDPANDPAKATEVREAELDERTELGQWGVSGGVLFTIQRAWTSLGDTQRVDPANPYSYDAYDLLSIADSRIEYRSSASGKRFFARRVSPDFKLSK